MSMRTWPVWANHLGWVSAGLILALAALGLHWWPQVPGVPTATAPTPATAPLVWGGGVTNDLLPQASWPLFHRPTGARGPLPGVAGGGPLAQRFRLAGSFFAYEGNGQTVRKAVLDDLTLKTQHLVSEGELLDEVSVVRIDRDHVLLRRGEQEETLWLSFSGGGGAATNAPPTPGLAKATAMEDLPALESNRFGKRVGENRWVMKRSAIMAYYQEMLDNPDRLAALFATFKPAYNATRAITGYQLGIEGEKPFLDAVGLQEGDVVRKVNSMNMTSQARAEYFIGEFAKDRVNAVVLDIERGGRPQKLIYMVR